MSGIRFHRKGPALPYALLRYQERGETVFLCGAGVSMGAGLPDFYTLVQRIYYRLDEDWESHPAEADGMRSAAHCAPDRTLFALKQRLQLGGEQIRNALAEELSTTSLGTDAHYDLLRLSRDSVRQRLITTNFDTLFERVWNHRTGLPTPSWAGGGMPAPGSADFGGVFHLHGRLADDTLGLPQSDLVLNSAEFGDAYLRSGWASRYLYDLLLHANVVIVGYSLNDPPTRYLFEALSADRDRFEFKSLYALAPASPSQKERVEALWRARGAIPLLYDPRGNNHEGLYGTIAGWAAYADNPTHWARTEAQRVFRKSPERASEEDWRRLDWILSRGDADRLIHDINPPARWLGPLTGRPARVQANVSLGRWIERRLAEPSMMSAVLNNPRAIDSTARRIVEYALSYGPVVLPMAKRQLWRLLLAQLSGQQSGYDDRLPQVVRMISRGDADAEMRRAICHLLAPRPKLQALHTSRRTGRGTLSALANVSFEPLSDSVDPAQICSVWPPMHDQALIMDLHSTVERSLSHAAELRASPSSVFQVPSIQESRQNHYRHGFNLIVRVMVQLWERLATSDAVAARRVADLWSAIDWEYYRRLWLHTLSVSVVYSGAEVGTAVLALSDDLFWGAQYQREVMRLLVTRWANIPTADRIAIEARIIGGDPR